MVEKDVLDKFTAHNILLDNGQKTMPDEGVLLGRSEMWKSIERTLELFIPQGSELRSKMRVVDLGCLEGGYSLEFARLGFDTLGIEAREDNIKKCEYVRENCSFSNLKFVKDDVRNLTNYGKFDITLCYGLLYHLNDPVNFLKTLSACTTRVLLLNTHFAPEHDIRYSLGALNKYLIAPLQKRTGFMENQKNFRLSKIALSEGFRGRWYKEWDEEAGKDKIEKMLWASYNNNRSFWLLKKDLTKALHQVGFDSVFEQFDFTGDIAPDNYTSYYNRTMFVAVKAKDTNRV